ncbi:zinc transporter ZntB [Pseudomonas sp. NW5]|uniref:zinc transporter ZntB n=1 Tax=Pseudomonas sp. NW5 TaxID=2934934 RepID=UPI002021D114|nr:zinc transporter ZntB [Pseudomonas sp. NW5]MCL7463363.1 zinc transporter ZntB [Pseudomonas sp. NW5]
MREGDQGGERGLVYGYVLDGEGGARRLSRDALAVLDLRPGESLWLHWDRSVPGARQWLRDSSGLNAFACDLLLEEATRPRLLHLGAERLLLFLRGVNRNPGAAPEDMVSLRIYADAQRVISLRLRPLQAIDSLCQAFERREGPCNASQVLLFLAEALTDHVDTLTSDLAERLDAIEEALEQDEQAVPDRHQLLTLRRQAASLRRYLAPQRDIYAQLASNHLSWRSSEDADQWNELHNRLIRNLEELELARERVSLLQEAEHRRITERMNRTMYLLGIITGFFLPMSFLTGLLGINVGGIPGSEHPYGFVLACLLIGGLALFQWWLFRRLRWL